MNLLITLAGVVLFVLGIVLAALLAMKAAAKNHENNALYNRRYDAMSENRPEPPKPVRGSKLPLLLSAVGVVAIVGASSFTIVPTGYTGVRTTFGLIDQESCMPGFNPLVPFVQTINLVNNKQQDLRFDDRVWAETEEQTVVYMEGIQVTYQIVPESSAWIYANVENWVEELVDKDITASALKSAARGLGAADVTDRALIQASGKDLLQQAVDEKYGENRVVIKNVIVNNMDFEESYNAAIAKKSEAIQKQQTQAIENQTAIDKAAAEAEATRQRAQGEADAELIRAQAKADANEIIAKSVSDATQRQDVIDAWNGELPRYVAGRDGSLGVFDVMDAASPKTTATPTS